MPDRRHILKSLAVIPTLAALGAGTRGTDASTGTCHNKTYRCKGKHEHVECGQGNTVNCIGRKGNYKGAATRIY